MSEIGELGPAGNGRSLRVRAKPVVYYPTPILQTPRDAAILYNPSNPSKKHKRLRDTAITHAKAKKHKFLAAIAAKKGKVVMRSEPTHVGAKKRGRETRDMPSNSISALRNGRPPGVASRRRRTALAGGSNVAYATYDAYGSVLSGNAASHTSANPTETRWIVVCPPPSSTLAGSSEPQLPLPDGATPRIWAANKEELYTIIPELEQNVNGVLWMSADVEMPVVIIEGAAWSGDSWDGGKIIEWSLVRSYTVPKTTPKAVYSAVPQPILPTHAVSTAAMDTQQYPAMTEADMAGLLPMPVTRPGSPWVPIGVPEALQPLRHSIQVTSPVSSPWPVIPGLGDIPPPPSPQTLMRAPFPSALTSTSLTSVVTECPPAQSGLRQVGSGFPEASITPKTMDYAFFKSVNENCMDLVTDDDPMGGLQYPVDEAVEETTDDSSETSMDVDPTALCDDGYQTGSNAAVTTVVSVGGTKASSADVEDLTFLPHFSEFLPPESNVDFASQRYPDDAFNSQSATYGPFPVMHDRPWSSQPDPMSIVSLVHPVTIEPRVGLVDEPDEASHANNSDINSGEVRTSMPTMYHAETPFAVETFKPELTAGHPPREENLIRYTQHLNSSPGLDHLVADYPTGSAFTTPDSPTTDNPAFQPEANPPNLNLHGEPPPSISMAMYDDTLEHPIRTGPRGNVIEETQDWEPLRPKEPPPEVKALLDCFDCKMLVTLIICETSSLLPFKFPAGRGCAFLGLFNVTNVGIEETLRDDPTTGERTFEAVWHFQFSWVPGGEVPHPEGKQLTSPWWTGASCVTPADLNTILVKPFMIPQYLLSADLLLQEAFQSSAAEEVSTGWYCVGCGKLNVQRNFRFQKCDHCLLGNDSRIPAVDADVVRDGYKIAPASYPFDRHADGITLSTMTAADGMRVFRYQMNGVGVVTHLFTGNVDALLQYPSELFKQFQASVELVSRGLKTGVAAGPYYTYFAGSHVEYDPLSMAWSKVPECVANARDLMVSNGLAYGTRAVFSIDQLTVLAWTKCGSRRGCIVSAKDTDVAIFCLGADVELSISLKSPTSYSGSTSRADPGRNGVPDRTASGFEQERVSFIEEESDLGVADIDIRAFDADGGQEGSTNVTSVSAAASSKVRKGEWVTGTSHRKPVSLVTTLAHGDMLVFSGDEYEYSLKRTGMSIGKSSQYRFFPGLISVMTVLIGSQ
ncbi:hypothetical protein OBBRIDRAFT_830158 [Obba rivulosa]|uniref:Uncharacterized protein n=1 Tax=Obba rivulosa TaxID=1052685 RepID=A0A8E2DUY6_9APHY|nr:hypothetical protein OBBRIDRAFT_830158 [Obba rivulosa]